MQVSSVISQSPCPVRTECQRSDIIERVYRFCIDLFLSVSALFVCPHLLINHDHYAFLSSSLIIYVTFRITILAFATFEIWGDIRKPRYALASLQSPILEENPGPIELFFNKDSHMGFRISEKLCGLGDNGMYFRPCKPHHLKTLRFYPLDLKDYIKPEVSNELLLKASALFSKAVAEQLNWCFSEGDLRTYWDVTFRKIRLSLLPIPIQCIPALFSYWGFTTLPVKHWDPSRIQLSKGQEMHCSAFVYRVLHAGFIALNRFFADEGYPHRAHLPGEGYELFSGITPRRMRVLLAI